MEVLDNIYMRYFMFSQEHYDKIKELEKKSGNKNWKPGQVIVSGVQKKYTSLVRNPETYSRRYSDARIIASGDIRKIKYSNAS